MTASARIFVAATDFPIRMYSLNGGHPSLPGPKVTAAANGGEHGWCAARKFGRTIGDPRGLQRGDQRCHFRHGVDAGVGSPDMGFNAVRLDHDEEMSTISHADIDPP